MRSLNYVVTTVVDDEVIKDVFSDYFEAINNGYDEDLDKMELIDCDIPYYDYSDVWEMINNSCDGSESYLDKRRMFIEATKNFPNLIKTKSNLTDLLWV